MRNTLLTLSFSLLCSTIFAVNDPSNQSDVIISQEDFESCKKDLSPALLSFVSDFETWPQQDKDKIVIMGLTLMVDRKLDQKITSKYENNVSSWIALHIK